jgi:hypothetical protein
MDYGDVLSGAWKIIWKHKILWIFGILAGCGSASGSGLSNSGFTFSSGDNGFYEYTFYDPEGWVVVSMILFIFLFVLVLIFLAILLGAIGRAGLIQGTAQVDQGAEKLSFGELFSSSLRYFWRLFGLGLLVGIGTFLFVLFIGVPFSIITCGIGVIVLIIILFLLPVFVEQSTIAIVVEDVGIIDGLKRGWDVFKDNLGSMIIMGLILNIGIGLIAALIIGIPMALLLIPIVTAAIAGGEEFLGAGFFISAICFVAFIPVLIAFVGILRSYISSAWTLTYLRLTGKPITAEPVEPIPEPS